MLLKSLSIRGLYRSLNLDVDFNEEITLLVGINGSGKTTVLNVVDWLLKPEWARLAIVQYDLLALEFDEDGVHFKLTATKTEKMLTLSIEQPGPPLKPITVALFAASDAEEEEIEARYHGLTPEKHELPMWQLLRSFSKPTVISLDRTLSAESEDVHYVEARSGLLKKRTQSPILFVQEVTSSSYADFRIKAIANDNELKANIVMSALQVPQLNLKDRPIRAMTEREIAGIEEKVSTYLSATIKSTDVRKQVERFFRASRVYTRRKRSQGQEELVFDFVTSRYRQIESLAKAFNDFEEKNALAFKPLNDYLDSVNRFFNDSGKELFFDVSTGKLAFSSIDTRSDRKSIESITHLSSGERQILVLFTFLAFAANPRSVFIVDEPELSLHPKWQSEFMEVFLKLRPEGTQLLLATHSPDIVGKYKKNCVALRGSRRE
jgi:predicted ATP-dependent endonuclease of OLD family